MKLMNSLEDLEKFVLLNGSTDFWFNLVDPVRDQHGKIKNPDPDDQLYYTEEGVVRKPEKNRLKKVTWMFHVCHPAGIHSTGYSGSVVVSGKKILKNPEIRKVAACDHHSGFHRSSSRSTTRVRHGHPLGNPKMHSSSAAHQKKDQIKIY
jgi:hypothetical protein